MTEDVRTQGLLETQPFLVLQRFYVLIVHVFFLHFHEQNVSDTHDTEEDQDSVPSEEEQETQSDWLVLVTQHSCIYSNIKTQVCL